METIIKYIIKVSVFGASFFGFAKLTAGLLNKKKERNFSMTDPEVIFVAGFGAAILTMFVTKVIVKLFIP